MAAITVAAQGVGMTMAAASGGGDTVASTGTKAGGWTHEQSPVLVVLVGATPTTVTIDGVAQPSVTSKTVVYPLNTGVYGRTLTVTYNQVTGVTVGAQIP